MGLECSMHGEMKNEERDNLEDLSVDTMSKKCGINLTQENRTS